MAKKFVRGITDIKTINNQDFDTNNVNDLLSDGEHNYIHRKKKDGTEEYHNLTDNIKTIDKVDNGLLTVTNYNKTKNSATLHVHHDYYKSQLLSSPNSTINVHNGENGTDETTSVDVNPEKVLQHNNLLTGDGISKTFSNNTTKLELQPTKKDTPYDVDTLLKGKVIGYGLTNAPATGWFVYESDYMNVSGRNYVLQTATRLKISGSPSSVKYMRSLDDTTWSAWEKQLTDESVLATKQNTLTSNTSIGIVGTGLMQLYSYQMSYADSMVGSLDTYAKTVKKDTNLTGNPKLEYHFTAELYEGKTSITIPLNENDTTYFEYILTNYNRTAMINGFVFSLSGSNLTISRDSSTYSQIVSFSDIIDPSQDTTK